VEWGRRVLCGGHRALNKARVFEDLAVARVLRGPEPWARMMRA
jgi:hypothetical protein